MSSSSSSTSTKLTPFQLPGFTLPLNFTPHEAYDADECIDGQWKKVHLPSQGEGIGLFKTALNEHDITQGYASLPLTTLREFTMLHIMNHLTDKPHWESKVWSALFISRPCILFPSLPVFTFILTSWADEVISREP